MPISGSRRTVLPPLKLNGALTERSSFARKDPSKTLTDVHRDVNITVENIERDILNFGDLLMRKQRSLALEVQHFLNYLEEQLNVPEITDANHLLLILEKNAHRTNILVPEYYDLQNICEKLLRIQYLLQEVPVKIDFIFNRNLIPYCLSLIEEVGNKEVPPITKEYEDIVSIHKEKLGKLVEEIDKMQYSKESQISIKNYIANHDNINKMILNWGEINLEICSIAKSWIDIDRIYPEKLRDTVFWLRNQRKKFTHKIHHLKKLEMKLESDRIKLESEMKRIESQTTQAHSDVTHYVHRERNAVAAKRNLERDIVELEDILDLHVNERARCSDPKKIAYHTDQIALHEGSLNHAQKRLHRLNQISNQFSQEQQRSSDSKINNQGSLMKHKEEFNRIVTEITTSQRDIREIVDKINAIEDQIIVVQRIASMKLDDNPFRNLNAPNYQPGTPKSYNDQTDDFFLLCSAVIGKLWQEVYKSLPFDPPRDWKKIEMDLEMIDINNRRLEPDFAKLSYLSLQKWRRLSSQANINNLVKVLKKKNLAKYVLPVQNKSLALDSS